MSTRAKHPPQEFNGVRFYRKPSGYYATNPRQPQQRYMHRFVWEHFNGPIPDGMHVHHIDHDRGNNGIENLELIERRVHCSKHARRRLANKDPGMLKGIAAAQEAAKLWHASPAGRQWHRQHALACWEKFVPERIRCTHCGELFDSIRSVRKRGFCSPACQSAARRASGVDDETRQCVVCQSGFRVNRYSKIKTCSRSCWRTLLSKPRK